MRLLAKAGSNNEGVQSDLINKHGFGMCKYSSFESLLITLFM